MFNAKFIIGCISTVIIEGLILDKSYLVIAFKNRFNEFFNPQWFFKNFVHYEGLEKLNKVNFSFNEKQYEKKVIKMFLEKKNKNFIKARGQLNEFYYKSKFSYDKNIENIVKKIL